MNRISRHAVCACHGCSGCAPKDDCETPVQNHGDVCKWCRVARRPEQRGALDLSVVKR